MKIHLLAIGVRMPDWVKTAYAEYAVRLPRECMLNLLEIAAGQRGPHADVARIVRTEGERLLAAVPTGSRLIALDERGQQWSTAELAERLAALYDYMSERLLYANLYNSQPALDEVSGLLASLREAWAGIAGQVKSAAA